MLIACGSVQAQVVLQNELEASPFTGNVTGNWGRVGALRTTAVYHQTSANSQDSVSGIGSVVIGKRHLVETQWLAMPDNDYRMVSLKVKADGGYAGDFRWQTQGNGDWELFQYVVPGYVATSTRHRFSNNNAASMIIDDVVVENVSAARVVEWADQWVETLPITPPTLVQYEGAGAWEAAPNAMAKLQRGENLKIVMLGDSIMNDTAHSSWAARVEHSLGNGANLDISVSFRNGTGMWWYQGEDNGVARTQSYVLDHNPELAIIGGLSHKNDLAAFQEVINQLRAANPDLEIIITSEAGTRRPFNASSFTSVLDPDRDGFQNELLKLALDNNAGFIDLRQVWGETLRSTTLDPAWAMRDTVHLNGNGQEVISLAMSDYFLIPEPTSLSLNILPLVGLIMRRRSAA